MAISTSSAKAKGRRLQQWVRDLILKTWPTLEADDCRSTSMGASGVDVQLSPAAHNLFGYNVECKARASMSVYQYYDQAVSNAGKYEPLVVIRANRKPALVLVDAEHFMELVRKSNGKK